MNGIASLLSSYKTRLEACVTEEEAYDVKAKFLGKDGELNEILKTLKSLSGEEKKSLGRDANLAKSEAQTLFDAKVSLLERRETEELLLREDLDVSMRESIRAGGLRDAGYHPLTLVKREVEDLFLSMGFDILDGPFIEDDFHNFTALNIPATHPARDMQDTFWFPGLTHCLRTQTSPMQIRAMETTKPPFKFVAPGKVFRNEDVDASHEMAFHQIEAMVVDVDVGIPHMIHFLKSTLSAIFNSDVTLRLRTGFFPFVEPGFELDIGCLICHGKGCPVCKGSGWVEFCGCGLVHPRVLRAGGVDPDVYSGFAFGMGWDRLVMMRYGIDDIRYLQMGDLRFNRRFKSY